MKNSDAKKYDWTVSWASAADESALLELFSKAFKSDMPVAQWRWKYAHSDPLGAVVREGDEIVAFYGGMPRGVRLFGKRETVVQIGDVMVAPSRRGILTRRGPLFLSASTFTAGLVGPGKRYAYGFGFPSARHNRLGEHLGLYARVGEVYEASWPPLPSKRSLAIKVRHFTADSLPRVDQLWHEMARDMSASVILERDAAHIKYRYIEHPTVSYQLFMVTQRLSGRPLGLVVLRDHGENGVELMDVVAVRSRLTMLIEVARRLTGELQRPRLFTWLTRPVADVMAGSQCSLVQTDVVIPVLIWEQSEENLKVRDRWWLMGGDTDFR